MECAGGTPALPGKKKPAFGEKSGLVKG